MSRALRRCELQLQLHEARFIVEDVKTRDESRD